MPVLGADRQFPFVELNLLDGQTISLPKYGEGQYRVVLFYRGSWCPYCNGQLRAFQRALPQLAEVNAVVVAASVDDAATTQALVDKHRLSYVVAHSVDARKVAEDTGAFLNEQSLHLQSTGFVLDPAGSIVISVYSSGAIGRLLPEDVVGLIKYRTEHAAG